MKAQPKLILMTILGLILIIGTVSASVSIDLVQKDGSWNIIPGGDWGNFNCNGGSFVFNGKGLTDGTEYTLISYAEPYPGTGSKVLGTDTANGGGNVHISGSCSCDNLVMYTYPTPTSPEYARITGAKIWLVPSSDLTGSALNTWRPSEYLFETKLITDTECGNPPIPTPEFPSLALPAAMIVGLIGIVSLIGSKEKNKN